MTTAILSRAGTAAIDGASPFAGEHILTVAHVMTRQPAVAHAHTSLFSAWAVMHEGQHRHLVVVDDDARPLGVVDELDIAGAWPAGPRAPHHTPVHQLLRFRSRLQVRATDDIVEAAGAMRDARVDALPVVDADGRLRGLLTAQDIVRLVAAVPARSTLRRP